MEVAETVLHVNQIEGRIVLSLQKYKDDIYTYVNAWFNEYCTTNKMYIVMHGDCEIFIQAKNTSVNQQNLLK